MGDFEGDPVGVFDGLLEVGRVEGCDDGCRVGWLLGCFDGALLGCFEGRREG